MDIALLEDEPTDAKVIQHYLESAGYKCHLFTTGRSLIDVLPDDKYALIIIDWELPDISGDTILNWIRTYIGWELPVIFVTGRDSTEDIVAMLEAGADDYMTKPIILKEMLARVNALVRRSKTDIQNTESIKIGTFIVDYSCHQITRCGERIEVTPKEFKLAGFLLKNTGKLISRKQLLKDIWGYDHSIHTRTIDIHISRIRKKLALIPENGWRLTSIYHEGYRLDHLSEDLADH